MAYAQSSASLREFLKPFQSPTLWRSIVELVLTATPLIVLWAAGAIGEYLGEDDIVRFDDIYGR